MRRWVAIAVGACAVLGTTGVAVASEQPAHHGPPVTVGAARPVGGTGGGPVGASGPAPADRRAPGSATGSGLGPGPLPGGAGSATPDGSDDTIGTVDPAGRTLGYLGGQRSMTFHHTGASYMKVHFNRLSLLPGDAVTVSDPSGEQSYTYTSGNPATEVAGTALSGLLGAGTPPTESAGAGQWAMSVDGDTAVVTMHTATADPAGLRSRLESLGVGVDKVARGFTAAERDARTRADAKTKADAEAAAARSGREESICGTDQKEDAACYRSSDPVPYQRSKAVARLLINGVELCSAWRVGPDNRMFTNHHCFTSTYDARNTEVWFNYECAACGSTDILRTTKVWANQVLATDQTLDYTLFTVQNFAAIKQFGYLQLDVRSPRRGEELYVPQHPAGDPTQIAIDSPTEKNGNCKVDDPTYTGYARGTDMSYYCDTEGGSSGSPVLSRTTNKVIGLHHFGGCPNSGVRIDLIYAEVRNLL